MFNSQSLHETSSVTLHLVTWVYSVRKGAVSWAPAEAVFSFEVHCIYFRDMLYIQACTNISNVTGFLNVQNWSIILIFLKAYPWCRQLPTSHHRHLGSVPMQSMMDFWKTKWHRSQLCLHAQGILILSGIYFCKMSCKLKLCKSNTKFLFKTAYFLGVRGFTTSSYIVYDHNTSGGQVVAQLVEALCYKLEGRGLDSRWCRWNFSLT